jgi:hypothetical protein
MMLSNRYLGREFQRCCGHLVSPAKLILRALNLRWRTTPANASLVSFSMESCPTSTKLPLLDQRDRSSPSIGIEVKSSIGSPRDLPGYDLTRSALKWQTMPRVRRSGARLDEGDIDASTPKIGPRATSDPLCSPMVRSSVGRWRSPRSDRPTLGVTAFRILVAALDFPADRTRCARTRADGSDRLEVCGHAVLLAVSTSTPVAAVGHTHLLVATVIPVKTSA